MLQSGFKLVLGTILGLIDGIDVTVKQAGGFVLLQTVAGESHSNLTPCT